MIFFARGEIEAEQFDEALQTRLSARRSKEVRIITELFLVGQPEVVAVFEADTVEEVVQFIEPYRHLGTFEIYPAVSTEQASSLFGDEAG